jgi:hypothetical protein
MPLPSTNAIPWSISHSHILPRTMAYLIVSSPLLHLPSLLHRTFQTRQQLRSESLKILFLSTMCPSSKCYQAHQHQLPTYQDSDLVNLYAVEAPHLDRDKFEHANMYNNPNCNHKFAALISLPVSSQAPRLLANTCTTHTKHKGKESRSQLLRKGGLEFWSDDNRPTSRSTNRQEAWY